MIGLKEKPRYRGSFMALGRASLSFVIASILATTTSQLLQEIREVSLQGSKANADAFAAILGVRS